MFRKSWLAGLDPATRQGMKKQTQRKPTRGKFSLLRQLCNHNMCRSQPFVAAKKFTRPLRSQIDGFAEFPYPNNHALDCNPLGLNPLRKHSRAEKRPGNLSRPPGSVALPRLKIL